MINIAEVTNPDKFKELGIMSLGKLRECIDNQVKNCELNHKDPYKVPVLIGNKTSRDDYRLYCMSMVFGMKGIICKAEFWGDEEDTIDYFEGEDKQPESGGEFWKSRGPSNWDVSGFVVSKEAGERLLQMVKNVLGKEECKTWLDWRKFEPNWIQFKFSAKEFDVNKLHELTKESGIITEEILKTCKL